MTTDLASRHHGGTVEELLSRDAVITMVKQIVGNMAGGLDPAVPLEGESRRWALHWVQSTPVRAIETVTTVRDKLD